MPAPGSFALIRRSKSKDFRLVQGALNEWTLSFPSDYGEDWSSFAARAQLRSAHADEASTILASITATIVSDGSSGTERIVHFELLLDPDLDGGVTLTETEGRWDCEITDGETTTYRIVEDPWSLNLEVTRT